MLAPIAVFVITAFQHTAARRRLTSQTFYKIFLLSVSTHSRPKAAEVIYFTMETTQLVSTHSRPKAAD